jgi:hypothetical protein
VFLFSRVRASSAREDHGNDSFYSHNDDDTSKTTTTTRFSK